MKFNRTRIAPTPSGYLHLGNAYAFALTAYLAERHGAKIMLRVDDMDSDRVQLQFIEDIFQSLNFLQIRIDEGPSSGSELESNFSQRLRRPLYDAALSKLAHSGRVYACRCSRSEAATGCARNCREANLALDEPDCSWRLKTGEPLPLTMKSIDQSEQKVLLAADMHDFVVRRKDRKPAYQICSLIDDTHYGVDLIVRGKDLLPSTIAQLYLAEILEMPNFAEATFYHHELLLGPTGAKLSKSAGDTSLRHLREMGMTSADLYTKLGRLAGIATKVAHFTDLGDALLLR